MERGDYECRLRFPKFSNRFNIVNNEHSPWDSINEDIDLAEALIQYGKRRQMPEAIRWAATVLHNSVAGWGDPFSPPETTGLQPMREAFSVAAPEEAPPTLLADEPPRRAARARGVSARSVSGPGEGNHQVVSINQGQTLTLHPNQLFPKNSRAVVTVSSDSPKKLFVYWHRESVSRNYDNYQVGKGKFDATWNTGHIDERWVVRIENRKGPDNLQVSVTTNAIG